MYRIFLLVSLLFLTSCQNDNVMSMLEAGPAKDPNMRHITAAIEVGNKATHPIDAQGFLFGEGCAAPGYVGKYYKAMLLPAVLSDRYHVYWENWDKSKLVDGNYIAEFDGSELDDVKNLIYALRFTYLGDLEWQLDVFKDHYFRDKNFLKTIYSVRAYPNPDPPK